jgi:hypothetical protein
MTTDDGRPTTVVELLFSRWVALRVYHITAASVIGRLSSVVILLHPHPIPILKQEESFCQAEADEVAVCPGLGGAADAGFG